MSAKALMKTTRYLGWGLLLFSLFGDNFTELTSNATQGIGLIGLIVILIWKIIEHQYLIEVVKPLSLILDRDNNIVRIVAETKVFLWKWKIKKNHWSILHLEQWYGFLKNDWHSISMDIGSIKYHLETGILKDYYDNLDDKSVFEKIMRNLINMRESVCEECLPDEVRNGIDPILYYFLAEFVSEYQPGHGINPFDMENYGHIKKQAKKYFDDILSETHLPFVDFTFKFSEKCFFSKTKHIFCKEKIKTLLLILKCTLKKD